MSVTISISGKSVIRVVDYTHCSCDEGGSSCICSCSTRGMSFYCLNYWQGELWRESWNKDVTFKKRYCPECDCDGTGQFPITEVYTIGAEDIDPINMANGVFRTFADALGIDCDDSLCGEIKHDELDMVIKNSIRLLNDIDSLVTETTCDQSTYADKKTNSIKKTAMFVSCGRDAEYWKMRLNQFISMCKRAKKLNTSVVFG